LRWAAETKSESHRQTLLDMAKTWMQAALEMFGINERPSDAHKRIGTWQTDPPPEMTYGDPHAAPAASHPIASRGEIATPAISLNR
jgi:hypothetical protein